LFRRGYRAAKASAAAQTWPAIAAGLVGRWSGASGTAVFYGQREGSDSEQSDVGPKHAS